jgi:hypothetical protein
MLFDCGCKNRSRMGLPLYQGCLVFLHSSPCLAHLPGANRCIMKQYDLCAACECAWIQGALSVRKPRCRAQRSGVENREASSFPQPFVVVVGACATVDKVKTHQSPREIALGCGPCGTTKFGCMLAEWSQVALPGRSEQTSPCESGNFQSCHGPPGCCSQSVRPAWQPPMLDDAARSFRK